MSPNASPAGVAGTLARVVVGALFVGGAVLAVTGRLVAAGTAFLAGHTLLAAAAVVQEQRRRGVGFSLSGVGWAALSIGLGASDAGMGEGGVDAPGTPLLIAGVGLVAVGTLLVVGAPDDADGATDPDADERA